MDAVHEHHLRVEALLRDLIERGQREGDFRDDLPAPWLAVSCLAVVHAAAASFGSGELQTERAVETLTTTVVDLCVGRRARRRRAR